MVSRESRESPVLRTNNLPVASSVANTRRVVATLKSSLRLMIDIVAIQFSFTFCLMSNTLKTYNTQSLLIATIFI